MSVIKINPYNFELHRFKVGAFLKHSVYLYLWSWASPCNIQYNTNTISY